MAGSKQKSYWNSVHKIMAERGCTLAVARDIHNGDFQEEPAVKSDPIESPVQRRINAARTLITECGGAQAAADLIETLRLLG